MCVRIKDFDKIIAEFSNFGNGIQAKKSIPKNNNAYELIGYFKCRTKAKYFELKSQFVVFYFQPIKY